MTNPVGSFIWYELATPDPKGASAFYQAVAGWHFEPSPPSAGMPDYQMIVRTDGGVAGGVMPLTPAMRQDGMQPGWYGYLAVENVDAATRAIVADGGRILMPATTITVGTFALVADPQGVPFYVMTPVAPPDQPDMASDAFSPDAPGHVRWNELATPDLDGARAFYARHFAFGTDQAMDMGELGPYRFIDHHGTVLGAMMRQPQPGAPGMWLPYIGVPALAAAADAIAANGGAVLLGPHEVPGGDWIVVARDPQGVQFGLVGPRGTAE